MKKLALSTNRQGRAGPNFVLSLVIGLLLFSILVATIGGQILSAGESTEGCSNLASIISDMFEGGVKTC